MDIKDKTILITGAAQGLGQSMAVALAQRGARLALTDLAIDRLQTTAGLCSRLGAPVHCFAADVAIEADVERLFRQVQQIAGSVDGLISNAGTTADALLVKRRDGALHKMSAGDFNRVVAVDLAGVFLCGREAAAQMIEAGRGGIIVNISSISQAGNMGQTNYAAAKAGVCALTVTWAQELAQYAIRVAAIAPGFSATDMVANMKPAMQEKFKDRIPLRRFARPEEIAHAAVFVIENDYFNGRILEIDGGLRL